MVGAYLGCRQGQAFVIPEPIDVPQSVDALVNGVFNLIGEWKVNINCLHQESQIVMLDQLVGP